MNEMTPATSFGRKRLVGVLEIISALRTLDFWPNPSGSDHKQHFRLGRYILWKRPQAALPLGRYILEGLSTNRSEVFQCTRPSHLDFSELLDQLEYKVGHITSSQLQTRQRGFSLSLFSRRSMARILRLCART